jgi:hypothetical protein
VVLLGSTVTNVALPHLGADFDVSLTVLQWTVNAVDSAASTFLEPCCAHRRSPWPRTR